MVDPSGYFSHYMDSRSTVAPRRFALTAVLMILTVSGCASYGVSKPLKPYSKLTATSEYALGNEALAILQRLEDGEHEALDTPNVGLCRYGDEYYLVSLKDETVVTEGAIYLGTDSEEAAEQIVALRRNIEQQKAVAQEALAQAIVVASESYSQAVNNTATSTYDPSAYASQSAYAAPVAKTAPKHWIADVLSSGKFIVLEDNTVWAVDSTDTYETLLWLPLTDVALRRTDFEGYNIVDMINVDDGESVSVTFLGTAVLKSQIKGEFEGWDGDTVFPLMNGQVLQQAGYKYNYHYAYMPKVVLVDITVAGVYSMLVDGVQDSVYVSVVE